jgi:hypothetical protein
MGDCTYYLQGVAFMVVPLPTTASGGMPEVKVLNQTLAKITDAETQVCTTRVSLLMQKRKYVLLEYVLLEYHSALNIGFQILKRKSPRHGTRPSSQCIMVHVCMCRANSNEKQYMISWVSSSPCGIGDHPFGLLEHVLVLAMKALGILEKLHRCNTDLIRQSNDTILHKIWDGKCKIAKSR